MDLLPVISNLIIYFLLALFLVLAVSFTYSHINKSKQAVEENRIIAEREKVRVYLRNHPYYSKSQKGRYTKYVRTQTYSVPTFSNESRNQNSRKTRLSEREIMGRRTRTSGDIFNERYSILNGENNFSNNTARNLNESRIFTSLKSEHYYKY